MLSRSRRVDLHQHHVRLGERCLGLGVSRLDELGELIAGAFLAARPATPWASLSVVRQADFPLLPSLEWAFEWIGRGEEVPQVLAYPYRIFFDRIVGLLYVLDQATRRGCVWIRHDQEIDLRAFITPFRLMISWLANLDDGELVHAACAVLHGQGVVFAGGPGAGKSTISLAAGLHGHRIVADDSVIIRGGKVHAVYARAKMTEATRRLLDIDESSVSRLPAFARAKAYMSLTDRAGFTGTCSLSTLAFPVLNPRIAHYPLTSRDAYRRLAAHSLPEVLGGGARNILRLAGTAKDVPAWRALLGTDMTSNLELVEDALLRYTHTTREGRS